MSPSGPQPGLTRRLHLVGEVYHAVTYFAPQASEAFAEIGLNGRTMAYFAGRAAPLGAVNATPVSALFYHFSPTMVAAELPAAWAVAGPAMVLSARLAGVDAALRAVLGEEIETARLAEAARLATEAASVCHGPLRPLGSANAALGYPSQPHLALWQALTTLREYRGDGHNIALFRGGFDGVEALVTCVGAGREQRKSIQARRGWTDDEWMDGERRLIARGLLLEAAATFSEVQLTNLGWTARQEAEDLTDALAAPPWGHLGAPGAERLLELLTPLSERIAAGLRIPAQLLPR